MAKEYIERKPILKFIEDGLNNPDKSKAFGHDAIEIMTEVQYAPTADVVEVVHGRWEYLQDDEWRCSNCHTVFNTGGKWIPMTDNFCSECGADMRERRDSNAAD